METRNETIIPYRPIHAGEILREELKERGISLNEFAYQIGVQPNYLNKFVKGEVNLSEDLAMSFERSLGIPYKYWIKLNSSFISDSVAIKNKEKESNVRYKFLHNLVNEMNEHPERF